MKFYSEIRIGERCSLEEGAYWIAFGRPPAQFYEGESEELGYFSIESLIGGEILQLPEIFDERDFHFCSIVPHDDYESLSEERLYIRDGVEVFTSIRTMGTPGGGDEISTADRARIQEIDAELWPTESVLKKKMNLARMALMESIINGEIPIFGTTDLKLQSISEATTEQYNSLELGFWEEVDPLNIEPMGIDFLNTDIESATGRWTYAHIKSEDLFKAFPRPLGATPSLEQLENYTGILVSRGQTSDAGQFKRNPRGRPQKDVAPMVRYFTDLANKGKLPSKRESIIQAAVDWCAKYLDLEISRSTAQNKLKPVFDILPKA